MGIPVKGIMKCHNYNNQKPGQILDSKSIEEGLAVFSNSILTLRLIFTPLYF